jgi:hypothetical protein
VVVARITVVVVTVVVVVAAESAPGVAVLLPPPEPRAEPIPAKARTVTPPTIHLDERRCPCPKRW